MLQMGCVLKAGVIGLNHKTADLALREAMARGANALAGKKAFFFPYPTVLLSTCNRTEIYFSAENLSEAHTDLLSFLRSVVGTSFEQSLYSYFHADCFAHLCRVTAGLDSAIVAETEIQRQVKVAYARSTECLALPSCLHYIFQKALKIGKDLRSGFTLEQKAPSLYTALYQIAEGFWGRLSEKRILLVGYSEINRGLASFLLRKKIGRFYLATRHPESVALEGAEVHGRDLLKSWSAFDWIVTASRSEEPLIAGESGKRHLICDLSVPRNVDPAVGKSPRISLLNIEEVNQWIDDRRRLGKESLNLCEEYVWDQVVNHCRIYREKQSAYSLASV